MTMFHAIGEAAFESLERFITPPRDPSPMAPSLTMERPQRSRGMRTTLRTVLALSTRLSKSLFQVGSSPTIPRTMSTQASCRCGLCGHSERREVQMCGLWRVWIREATCRHRMRERGCKQQACVPSFRRDLQLQLQCVPSFFEKVLRTPTPSRNCCSSR